MGYLTLTLPQHDAVRYPESAPPRRLGHDGVATHVAAGMTYPSPLIDGQHLSGFYDRERSEVRIGAQRPVSIRDRDRHSMASSSGETAGVPLATTYRPSPSS